MESELEVVAVGTMDECGEREARKGLSGEQASRPKIKDWTGPGSVGVSEQATVSDSSSSH